LIFSSMLIIETDCKKLFKILTQKNYNRDKHIVPFQ